MTPSTGADALRVSLAGSLGRKDLEARFESLLAENRVEWLIADMGILAAAAVNVSPHAPLTSRQVQFQFGDAGVRAHPEHVGDGERPVELGHRGAEIGLGNGEKNRLHEFPSIYELCSSSFVEEFA